MKTKQLEYDKSYTFKFSSYVFGEGDAHFIAKPKEYFTRYQWGMWSTREQNIMFMDKAMKDLKRKVSDSLDVRLS